MQLTDNPTHMPTPSYTQKMPKFNVCFLAMFAIAFLGFTITSCSDEDKGAHPRNEQPAGMKKGKKGKKNTKKRGKEEATNAQGEMPKQPEGNPLEIAMLRYYNNANAIRVLGAASVCLGRCFGEGATTYSMETQDKKHFVTVNLPQIDGDTYDSASGEVWGESYNALLADNKAIIASLKGRKLREFEHLEARAAELPFGGEITLKCGGKITIKRVGE